MRPQVIAIGLDAGDPILIDKWVDQGKLPSLQSLREKGAHGSLDNMGYYKAETPWTSFLTGCLPQKTGYWSPFKFQEGSYEVEELQAYDFQEYPPFYALGSEYRVAAFDIPQSHLAPNANGLQVLAWGAHSPQTPSHSLPETALDEINRSYGKHPALHKDHGDWWDEDYLKRLYKSLHKGLDKRVKICHQLLEQERWDLFLTIFGETHSAGHDFWYLSDPTHPLYSHRPSTFGNSDPLLDVFQATDRAIGNILEKAPKDSYVAVFAAHGSGNNTTDVSSMLLLPEFLYRLNFPGEIQLAPGKKQLPGLLTNPKRKTWTGEIWQTKYDKNPVKRLLRKQLPSKWHRYLDQTFGTDAHELRSPEQLRADGHSLFWQPSLWYKDFWPQMKAFALPSFSEGYIRINLSGREPNGIVDPQDYAAVCEELIQELHQIINPRTGRPVIKKVVKTRQSPFERDAKLPDADLVVVWDEEPTDVVDHPTCGRIGPVPYRRTGSHRGRGFLTLTGPDIAPGSQLRKGHGVDLAPTLLHLMGAPIPDYCDGVSLLESAQVQAQYA